MVVVGFKQVLFLSTWFYMSMYYSTALYIQLVHENMKPHLHVTTRSISAVDFTPSNHWFTSPTRVLSPTHEFFTCRWSISPLIQKWMATITHVVTCSCEKSMFPCSCCHVQKVGSDLFYSATLCAKRPIYTKFFLTLPSFEPEQAS
jgi:hypothetical protein